MDSQRFERCNARFDHRVGPLFPFMIFSDEDRMSP